MSKKRRTREQWQQLVDDQRLSGLTVNRYCQANNITESNFYLWRKKLSRRAVETGGKGTAVAASTQAQWIELTPSPIQNNEVHWDVELSLPQGVMLRMRTS